MMSTGKRAYAYPAVGETGTTGIPVGEGDLIRDFRGEVWAFVSVSRVPEPGKSGKVTVTNGSWAREFYPQVFGLRIVEVQS